MASITDAKTSPFPFCEDYNKYLQIQKIGQGTFGEVHKVKDKISNKVFASKKILMEKETQGFPITALREIKILKSLDNKNIVELIEICKKRNGSRKCVEFSTFYLIFEFCEHDLSGLLKNHRIKFGSIEIRSIIKQLLQALHYIHHNKILHRDLKTSNILITKEGVLKLADFGLSRAISSRTKEFGYTNCVVTLWYRPPELILGEKKYGPPIDIWGAGCVLGEMVTRSALFRGHSEIHQLRLIVEYCGSISPTVWPEVVTLPRYDKFKLEHRKPGKLREHLKRFWNDPLFLDLLDKLLMLDPSKRICADEALDHDLFWKDPLPEDIKEFMSTIYANNFEYTAQGPGRPQEGTAAAMHRNRLHQLHMQHQQADTMSMFQERVY